MLIGDAASIAVVLPTIYIPIQRSPSSTPILPYSIGKNMPIVGANGGVLGTWRREQAAVDDADVADDIGRDGGACLSKRGMITQR